MFRQDDLEQINKQGISINEIEKQLHYFRQGFPFICLAKPATLGDGIFVLNAENEINFINLYNEYTHQHKILKFVPASGAASRMFKDLYAYIENEKTLGQLPSVQQVIEHIEKFAFYNVLKKLLSEAGFEIKKVDAKKLVEFILTHKGLNYGMLPKALILFHRYSDGDRTSLEEHLVEGALYAYSNKKVYLHFTVSPEHRTAFEARISQTIEKYEKEYQTTFEIAYSIQSPATDTIAVDMENNPFRDKNGKLVFRPGGHGALIHNLNKLDADLIFIKNIDNVVPDRLKDETIRYKKLLAGFLIFLQDKLYTYQQWFDENKITPERIAAIKDFYKTYFHVDINAFTLEQIKAMLFRPLRVCGMVKNEGEPGGGPFWVKDKTGAISLQIVESSQVDFNNAEQTQIFKQATHFNPVDLVCSIKNYKGEKYNLLNFIDHETGFISQKSKDGKPLKALELPGLWNGAMAFWNTIFVEVPMITFNPVKTINDLLRPQHLNG
ncbi:MAG: DUF4301 family protein [Bacteroidales bacterium]|nr:DUF4301 family protein [Bacteroidales bacterium]